MTCKLVEFLEALGELIETRGMISQRRMDFTELHRNEIVSGPFAIFASSRAAVQQKIVQHRVGCKPNRALAE